jgi:AraC family transcriptional regulator
MKRPVTPESLRPGETYGRTEVRAKTAGFVISVMRPVLPPEDVPVHTHPEGSFTFILSGFQISSANHEPCGPGTLIYNPPGTTHRDRFQNVENGKFLHISVPDEVTESLELPNAPTRLRRHEPLGFARAIARECLAWDERSPQFAEGLCLELLADTGQTQAGPRTGSVPAWLTEAQELLTESCTEPISITKVARTVGVHPAHLARNFSRFFKRSPGEHLRRSRIATATELLLETDLALAEIALACGFADQSHFTHLFKRQKGLSPAAYRAKAKASRLSK